jgi:hypothetical protein
VFVRVRVLAAAAVFFCLTLSAVDPGYAQAPSPPPPGPGFVPPYEITRIVHAAGFEPLAPPLREGPTYVLRATDFRGILMRVVVDGHSGAIRAVNRIVPGPGSFGAIGMVPPTYGAPEVEASGMSVDEESAVRLLPPATRAAAHPMTAALPPLPRPRPVELTGRKIPEEAKSDAAPQSPVESNKQPAAADKMPAIIPLDD